MIKDVDGKPFSEYGRYLVDAGQVIVVVQGTGGGAPGRDMRVSMYILSRLNAKV